jgi:hypothetical protein
MDQIQQLLARISELTSTELGELRDLISSTFDTLAASDEPANATIVAQLDELVLGLGAVADEETRRSTEAAESAAKLEATKAKMEALRNPVAEDAPAEEDEPAEIEAEGEEVEGEVVEIDSPLLEPVLASAPRGSTVVGGMVPAMARVTGRAAPSPTQEAPAANGVRIIVAAGVPHFNPGEDLTDPMMLAKAMSETLNRKKMSHDRTAAVVASARWDYPEDRQLGPDASSNTNKINAVCGLNAGRYRNGSLVATGGVCLPVNVDYTVPTWSTADRPLRDALPGYQADRGGIRFVTPPDIGVPPITSAGGDTPSGAGQSTGTWNEATDANPAGALKPVWTVECGAEQLVYVNAVTTRVQFGNMESRFAPEQVAANTQQAVAITARQAEVQLLTAIADLTVQVIPSAYLGAARDLLTSIDLLTAQYKQSHRFSTNVALTAIFPDWGKNVIRADLARELAHDNTNGRDVLAISDVQIEDWFTIRGINPVWTLDGLPAGTYGTGGSAITDQNFPTVTAANAANSGSAITPVWPGQTSTDAFMLVWFLFVEGTFQFLDGGTLDLGVVRDSLLDSTNDYETFTETFENVAFRGIEAYQVQSMIRPTGGSAGTVAVTGYIE